MSISLLCLQQFRNLSQVNLELKKGLTLLCGQNGQGKSNLLESIHLLTLGYSPRTSKNTELIAWGATELVAIAQGESLRLPQRHALQLSHKSHRIKINHEEYTQYSKLLGHFGLVMLGPEDLEIIKGGPAQRRHFMDALFSQHSPIYLDALRRYHRTLKQRNALLKMEHLSQDDYWEAMTHQWATEAARVVELRLEYLAEIIEPFKRLYGEISEAAERVHLSYQCPKLKENQNWVEHFMSFAYSHFDTEKRDGATKEGPHRDDLLILISGKIMRSFGSQGQCRTAALCLRLAAAEILHKNRGESPILLLDDVFAELDGKRQKKLAEIVRQYDQVIAASPEVEGIPIECDQVLRVRAGCIIEE